MDVKSCDHCGKPLSKGRRRFCSNVCSDAAYNERRRKPFDKAGVCRHCNREFAKAQPTQRYCSPLCKSKHEREGRKLNTTNECSQCGAEFVISATNKKYCPDCIDHVDPIAEKRKQLERRRKKRELEEALLDEAARTQVVSALLDAQERHSGWKPKRFVIPRKKNFPEQHANILFGDWHLGEAITPEETGGLAEYNTEIARERARRCVEAQAEIVQIYTDGGIPIRHCNVSLLGDMVTGEKIYRGQHAYIDNPTADQVVETKQLLAETLLNMLDIYESITCRCVVGNHGRMGEKGEGPTWNNYDYLVYRWTADYLRNYSQISWEIPRSWFHVYDVLSWRFCASHGDDVQMYKRIPWYGLERDINDMSAMLWDIEQSPPNYWLYAHFHTAEQAEQVHGERLMNGSMVGGSMLSAKGLKRVSRPSQTFFGVSEKKGITWRYNLYLS